MTHYIDILQCTDPRFNLPPWIKAQIVYALRTPPTHQPLVHAMNLWLERTQCRELWKIKSECTDKLARCLANIRVFVGYDSDGAPLFDGIQSTEKAPREPPFSNSLTLHSTEQYGHVVGRNGNKMIALRERVPSVVVRLVDLTVSVFADTQLTADLALYTIRAALNKVAQYVPRDTRCEEVEAREEAKRFVAEQRAQESRVRKIERKKKLEGEKDEKRVAWLKGRKASKWSPKGRKEFVCCQ